MLPLFYNSTVRTKFISLASITIIAFCSAKAFAQDADSLKSEEPKPKESDKITVLMYVRVIRDAAGNVRMDENIVPNFRLNKWLRLELGIRQGERPQQFGSYNHYKVELRTKSFFKTIKFLARLSDNIIEYPSPEYVKSNYLFIAEGKHKISGSFTALISYGYVFTYQQNNNSQVEPITQGVTNNYPTYKIGLRYALKEKGFIEATYGAYDVFNPYLPSSPFTQATLDYELSRRWAFYSYFRYQFYQSLNIPLNYFTAFGVKLKIN
jgi:hypothetical protein